MCDSFPIHCKTVTSIVKLHTST